MERIPPISEMIQMVLRHVVLVTAVMVVGIVAAVFYAMAQPQIYQTSAVVQIGQEAVPGPGSSTGTNGAALQRLQEIELQMMARDNLAEIIERFDLYGGDEAMSLNDRVFALRNDTNISQIIDEAYRWRPDVAPTALLIEVTNGDPLLAAEVANALVQDWVEQSRSNRTGRVSGALAFFESEEARITAAISALDAQIADFKTEFAGSLPDAIASQRDKLLTLEEQELAIEQQMIEISSSVRPDRAQLTRLEEQLALLRDRKAVVEEELAGAPAVERELNVLVREQTQLNSQYDNIATRRAEAEMGQMLESSQQSESFVVLEQAQVPEHPIAPNRKKIVAMGGAMALVISLVTILVVELRNPVLRTSAQMQRQLGILPVVAIPNIEVRGERVRRRLLWMSAAALVVLLGVLAVQVAMGQR